MSYPVYLSAQPDYFPIIYTAETWERTLEQIENVPEGSALCLDDNGLSTAGKIYTFWQKIKALLGFQDLTDEVKMGAFLARFMFQGAMQGYIQKHEPRIRTLQTKIDNEQLRVHQGVKSFFHFDEIANLPVIDLQQKIVGYFRQNAESLKPSFWNRIFAPTIHLPLHARFGETPLILAQELEEQDPNQSLEEYKIAAQLCNLGDLIYTQDLVRSFERFASKGYCYAQKLGPVTLQLAERMFKLGDMSEADRLFAQAAQQWARFSEKQKVFYLHSSLQMQRYDEVEKRANAIDLSHENSTVKKLYTQTMIKLGDHYSSKRNTFRTRASHLFTFGTTPSSADHSHKADKFYELGLSASRHDQDLLPLQHTILDKQLEIGPSSVSAHHFSLPNSKPAEPLHQIFHYLRKMKGLNPLDNLQSLEAAQNIELTTSGIMKFYLQNGPDHRCLALIEKALKFIGDIKKRFKIKTNLLKTRSLSIACTTEGLVSIQNHFNFDVGASLHFLRAEILRKEGGDTEEVLEEYKSATNLALANPFGAEALFMIDEQKNQHTLVSDIESYRKLAVEWGTPELKELVQQQDAANI